MNTKKLLSAIGDISDKHIESAAPGRNASYKKQVLSPKIRFMRYAAAAACAAVFMLATTAFAANYIQNSISGFYMRYLSPEEMAVSDSMAEQYGVKVYFDALKSDDINKQYFAINKLVEYYNDEETRLEAVNAITPFLINEEDKIVDAATFALSVLKGEFDHPNIINMADGTVVFTLFNDYSDYGSYNQIWTIRHGELSVLTSFDYPKMYIRQILPSPDKRLFAVAFVSNKSSYLLIWDMENGRVSPELVDSTRVMVAKDLEITYWQQIDNENYSGIHGIWEESGASKIEWTDNNIIEFSASLWYSGTDADDPVFINNALVRYDFRQSHIEYEIIKDNGMDNR